jgi:hypothetical protein
MPSTHQQPPVELQHLSGMERIRRLFKTQQRYEPIQEYREEAAAAATAAAATAAATENGAEDAWEFKENPFSQVEYWIFLLMGIAMLWAW